DLVVHGEDSVGLHLVEPRRRADRPARLVHVRLRLQQRDPVAVDADLRKLPGELSLPRRTVPAGAPFHRHPPATLPVPYVLATRVAEPDDKEVERRGTVAPAPRETHEA